MSRQLVSFNLGVMDPPVDDKLAALLLRLGPLALRDR